MSKSSRLLNSLLAIVLMAAAYATHAAKPAVPPIEKLAAYPKMSSFTLSPDGKHLAALHARGKDSFILVWNTNSLDKAPTVIDSSRIKVQTVHFIKHGLLSITMWQPFH